MSAKTIRVGLIGSGFMGRSHALAFRMAPAVFDLPAGIELAMLADVDEPTAAAAAKTLCFERSTGDWRQLVNDPNIDLVAITTPNKWHKPMALAAIDAGKAVYCEKPLAPNASDAKAMADAAQAKGALTFVGFNYLKNPLVCLARDLVQSGEIGEVWSFRGWHAEDYMRDAAEPWSWRLDPAGGAGVVADLGSHIIAMAHFLVGPIETLSADIHTVIKERPVAAGSIATKPVEVDDMARALLRFANGASGMIEASWVASGRKLNLAFELTGSLGTIIIDMERMNEIRLYRAGADGREDGFKTILANADHADYAPFCPAPGHQLGFNDIKAIEVKHIIDAMMGGPSFQPDFAQAYAVQKVVDGMLTSAREQRWVHL